MSMKLFDVVSVEEQNEVVETTMDVLEVVAMEDMDHDVSIVAGVIGGQIAAMESSLEVADMLDAKIAIEEAIVEAGTATQGIALMALSSLQNTASLIGMNPDKFAISNESMEANPTTALKVSVESAKETFKAIIEKIKAFFSKVWSNIKKMSGKLLLMVVNYEKTFKSLEEKASKLGAIKEGEDGKLSESQQVKLVNKDFAGTVAVEDGLTVLKMAEANYAQTIGTFFKTNGDLKDGDLKVSTPVDSTKFVAEITKSYDSVPEIKGIDTIILSRIDGDTIKGEVIKVEHVAKPAHVVVNFVPFSAKAKKDVVTAEAKKVTVLDVAAIKAVITSGAKEAGETKNITAAVDGLLKAAEAALGEAKESAVEADKAALDKAHGSNLSRLSTSALRHASGILLGHIASMKNKASVAQIHMSKYQVAK